MLTRHKPLILVSILGVVGLAGCADQGQLSEEEAVALWRDLEGNLDGHRNTTRGGVEVDVLFDADCPQAGSIEFDGTWRYNEAVEDGWVVVSTFDYDLGFDGCTKRDRTLDGFVEWDSAFNAVHEDDEGEATYQYHWQGDLEVSGDMEGSCAFDVVGTVAATYTSVGGTFDASMDKQYEGTLCGHDARKLLVHAEF